MKRVAVIDTGTNTTRLMIADVTADDVVVVDREAVITRLGERVSTGGTLLESARSRVEECVSRYMETIESSGAGEKIILATSSIRDAADGPGFIASLAQRHSLRHAVLSGEQESCLSFRGASMAARGGEIVKLIDIGGGSTEMAWGRGGVVERSSSLQVGCVRVTERFIAHDPPLEEELDAAGEFLADELARAAAALEAPAEARLIAVAGTMTTLAAIDLGLQHYDSAVIDGHVLELGALESHLSRLAAADNDGRLSIGAMEQGRADVIVAGTMIAIAALRALGAVEATVSERDILDGAARAIASGEL